MEKRITFEMTESEATYLLEALERIENVWRPRLKKNSEEKRQSCQSKKENNDDCLSTQISNESNQAYFDCYPTCECLSDIQQFTPLKTTIERIKKSL
ncbi:MAG: hypothetical protein N4A59_02310 [Marinifilum sp.]|jgi:hypothetical protein|nr:hypothetical protein [Marinifilum sp.]MCT4644467.1 hypothetical protein [Carboxylicivirga sp.]